MNKDVIERLSIDLAAGELNEDVRILFKTYLDEHSQAKKWSEDIFQIYSSTETAINSKIRAISQTAAKHPEHKIAHFRYQAIRRYGRWAAVIALAFILGGIFGRKYTPVQINPEVKLVQEAGKSIPFKESIFNKAKDDGFWRDKITAALTPKPNLVTTSKSTLMEQYRQYMKGHNYE
ncbi:MAG: hypothetical protein JW837_03690 [Sedimentisphaerales bacterium]|nr:hypothetical protein [Sedimentisphaerales bacterium]